MYGMATPAIVIIGAGAALLSIPMVFGIIGLVTEIGKAIGL